MLRVTPLLDPLQGYVEARFRKLQKHVPRTESTCNRLHYRMTAILFLGTAFLNFLYFDSSGILQCYTNIELK